VATRTAFSVDSADLTLERHILEEIVRKRI
jgi:hypothetical protein